MWEEACATEGIIVGVWGWRRKVQLAEIGEIHIANGAI